LKGWDQFPKEGGKRFESNPGTCKDWGKGPWRFGNLYPQGIIKEGGFFLKKFLKGGAPLLGFLGGKRGVQKDTGYLGELFGGATPPLGAQKREISFL